MHLIIHKHHPQACQLFLAQAYWQPHRSSWDNYATCRGDQAARMAVQQDAAKLPRKKKRALALMVREAYAANLIVRDHFLLESWAPPAQVQNSHLHARLKKLEGLSAKSASAAARSAASAACSTCLRASPRRRR